MADRARVNEFSLSSDEKRSFIQRLGLRDQIRRAVSSSMYNIVEGFDSGLNADFDQSDQLDL